MTQFNVNGYELRVPLVDFEIEQDIIILLNGKGVRFSQDAIKGLKDVLGLSAFYKCDLVSKYDVFGLLKLFHEHIIPSVAAYLKVLNVTLNDKHYSNEMFACFHYYNAANTLRQIAIVKNYRISNLFNNIIDKIIDETFKVSDIEKIIKLFEYFDMTFDKNITNISLVMTRFIDNIISGYIPSEVIHAAPSRVYGHLCSVILHKINPLRIKSGECITDISSDDEDMDGTLSEESNEYLFEE